VRRLLLILTALAAAVYVAAPPRAGTLPSAPAGLIAPVRGVFHVHTNRSDGSGTVEQVARAASQAGLRFVILTDHGDATRTPDPPAYHGGVLVIDAVEISTDGGHVVALGLPKSPYPLAGEARDVVEDIARMGGSSIAAHPASRKPDLKWTDWNVPIQGLEHINGDSEWRDESAWLLARALLAYPVRPVETLGLLFDHSEEVTRRWDALTKARRVVALAAADAHGRIGLRAQEPYRGRLALPIPGYESVFRSMSIALPRARFSSDAAADARVVLEEIRHGRVFSSVDALAARPAFEFTATSARARATGGEALAVDGPARIDVVAQAPPDARIVLLRDGTQLVASDGRSLHHDIEPLPATYRVEVRLPGAPGEPPIAWIVSNSIYVNRETEKTPEQALPPGVESSTDLYTDGPASEWTVEHSSASRAALDVVNAMFGTQLLFRYAISGGPSSHPFAALVTPAGPALAEHERLTFTARADRAMRLSVQLRAHTSDPAGERWHRSVFVDTSSRQISVRFDEMTPRGRTSTPKPPLEQIRSVLFVVDTVNTPAGTAGQLSLDDLRYER
jgi:hypothetical protein